MWCHSVISIHLHGFFRRILLGQKSESSEDRSMMLESVSIVSSSVSSCNFSLISFTVSTCEGFLYVFGFEVPFENVTDLDWVLNFVFCGWLLVVKVDLTQFLIILFTNFNFFNFWFMSCHISIGIWALVLNVFCMVWSECWSFSMLVLFGLGQSFMKWFSSQLKHFVWGFDLLL